MAEENALTIAALPADGHAWRIDWFGEIAFPNRMIRRKQPSVLLHLSRVIDERYREDHSVLLNPESTFVAKQRKVWVSVGTLPLLRIGVDLHRTLTHFAGNFASKIDLRLRHNPT